MNTSLAWFREEPPPVRAVIALAYIADGAGVADPIWGWACELVGEHAGTVREVAVLLDRIERLTCGSALPSEIADWAGAPEVSHLSHVTFDLIDEYKDEAVAAATKVAKSLAGSAV